MLGCVHRDAYFEGTLAECPVLREALHKRLERRRAGGRRKAPAPRAAAMATDEVRARRGSWRGRWAAGGLVSVMALLRFLPDVFDGPMG